jgi:diadenosine tetraphosphate (Ap4A) HIT family hydrolase
MRVLLDIKDSEAVHLMRVLRSLPYVKELTISPEKEELVEEIKEAVENLKLVREGKLKARPARELLDEL